MSTNLHHEYEPTGLASINQIPTHWYARRLGQIGTFTKGSGGNKDDATDYGLPCIRYGDIYTSYKYHARHARSYISKDRAPDYARLKHGDALFAASGETVEDIGKSVVNLMTEEAYCGPDVILFRPEAEINPSYLGYVLDCPQIAYQKSCMGRGITIMHIYSSSLKYITIPLPPLEEQAAIVRYLDHADEIINRYISAKERLIALLEEQRQAFIHQAVTQGLGQTVPMKHSDIPELGVIPNHWKTISLGQLGSFSKGGGGTKDDQVEEGIPCVRYGDIYTSHKYFVRKTTSFIAPTRVHDYARMQYGDVLFTGSGETIEDIGKSVVNLIHGEAYCGGDVIMLRPHGETVPKFLGYLLDSPSLIHQKSSIGRGITIMHVYSSQLKYIRLALPPLSEQAEIGEFLEKATRTANNAIDNAKQQIDLMNEYRTRLIADVVTGQLDVRSADANDLDMLEAHS